MSKALDVADAAGTAAKASEIAAKGFTAVGCYYFQHSGFKTLLTASVARAIMAAGLLLWSIYENGEPTSAGYFTTEQGNADAHAAYALAVQAEQPLGSAIYFTVDCDISDSEVGAVLAYFAEVHRVLGVLAGDGARYLVGIYGPGVACRATLTAGTAHFTWLSGSTSFNGYADWIASADIVQGPEATVCGLDVDTDSMLTIAGVWNYST